MKKVFLDTETTGLAPGQICQLSLIIEHDNGEIKAKNYFFNIDYITKGAEQVCGRGLDFYSEHSKGLRFSDYKDEILEHLEDSTLIAHNLKFDENFISTEFWRQNIMFKPTDRFDTMTYFKDICKIPYNNGSRYKNPKLEELIDYLNINKDLVKIYSEKLFNNESDIGFHDARYDTTALFVAFHVYQDMINNNNSWINTFVRR